MITTTHARPSLHAALRAMSLSKVVVCPRCCKPLGAAHGARHTQELLGAHRCPVAAREMLQPSTAVPFS